MNIGEIIKNKKVSIFFEDTGMKNNVIDINNENPNIGIFFENMGIYDEEIVVISQKENKEKIFKSALKNNVSIDFFNIGKLRSADYDTSYFKNKIILFNKCFDGMTSENNNTYKNIKEIVKNSYKFIFIEAIGENFLIPEYFIPLLRLSRSDIKLDIDYNIDYLTHLLEENVKIIKNNVEETENFKKYWRIRDFSTFNTVFTPTLNINPKLESNSTKDNTKSSYERFFADKPEKNSKKKPLETNFKFYNQKNKYLLYLALSFLGFFGIAGIQHFVQKKILKGFLYFLTLGFFYIGTIYDIVYYISKYSNEKK